MNPDTLTNNPHSRSGKHAYHTAVHEILRDEGLALHRRRSGNCAGEEHSLLYGDDEREAGGEEGDGGVE